MCEAHTKKQTVILAEQDIPAQELKSVVPLSAVSLELCGGGNGLCGCGETEPENV